ncbi:Daunorubicin/doxorubicin resistance ATP-binding protein DrrA [Pirellula sp. SH-Sr6A]|uniref:ABC transporter ATP-binding protein n=1 Tax=Pirellula sp. SH-Sr6A TaxID=1632865 RepID=UPI00078C11DF|nr:ABC transporter ATP-binding protein [Pirellula sp. SH-Sr6A]AMV34640.1 Daunorubicin/doxorubicin resistance ATP-binding protein DrrA [Pirellula sp. SH-Sr6A]
MKPIAISANNLTRYFGKTPTVRQVSFDLPVGTVTGLLGLNGAGKSTLIKMLMGLLAPTRGTCSVLGVDSTILTPSVRARIGYTIEGHFAYGSMTVRDSEQLQSDSFPNWNPTLFQNTIDRFGIRPTARIRTLSRGQRAGVSIALTMSSIPELLILDDPALGLDPVSRRALNETILEFMEDDSRTVLLSSHLLDDIERVTDRVLVMVDGRILVNSTVSAFLERVSIWSCDTSGETRQVPCVPGLIHAYQTGRRLTMAVVDVDQESEAAMVRIGGPSLSRSDSSFDECVVAYLSRSRSSHSFLGNSATATSTR